MGWRLRGAFAAVIVVAAVLIWAVVARALAPAANASLPRFDAIIVLGSPADADGNPTPIELARVLESVREYQRGAAPRILFTGGAVSNSFVEAEVMANAAAARGIPPSAIVQERRARDTIGNACYATRIMQAHGWRSAEVISSADHLPRVGMIFSRMPIEWRLAAAPPLTPPSPVATGLRNAMETLKTVHYLVYGQWAESCRL